MIKLLPIKVRFSNQGNISHYSFERMRCRLEQLYVSGTWIAVSPNEKLPERYKDCRDPKENVVRVLYDIPSDWSIYKISEKDNDHDLVDSVIDEVYSIPTKKTVKELWDDCRYLWVVLSPDLNYPQSYNHEILKRNQWIEKGGWTLFCVGLANTLEVEETIRESFKSTLPPDITYEERT